MSIPVDHVEMRQKVEQAILQEMDWRNLNEIAFTELCRTKTVEEILCLEGCIKSFTLLTRTYKQRTTGVSLYFKRWKMPATVGWHEEV